MRTGKDAILNAPLLDDSKLARQIALERECMEQGALAYRESVSRITDAGEASRLKAADPLFHAWFEPVCSGIRKDMRLVRRGSSEVGVNFWGPIFQAFGYDGIETMAGVALHETVSMCLQKPAGVRTATLSYHIGRDLTAHLMLSSAKENHRDQYDELYEKFRDITARLVYRWGKKTLADDPDWERKFATHAGMRLIWHVLINAECPGEGGQPEAAFLCKRMLVRQNGGRMIRPSFILVNDRVIDMMDRNHDRRAHARPRYTFMLVEPMPWTKTTSGNYVRHKTSIFTKATREQQEHSSNGDMSRVHEAHNAINQTKLRINLWILGVQQEIWNRGGNIAGIPRADDIPLPEFRGDEMSDDDRLRLRRLRWKARKDNRQAKAGRILFSRMLGVAERFANEPYFWSPNMLDFRGRFYARPLYLSHNEDDTRRGLLEFGRGKDVGDDGERWVRIHAANCYGVDKLPFSGREEWVDSHANEIERCVRDPIAEEFWRHADDPWQFLAACRALVHKDAARHIPIALDGSANGLQHYSAMGRDSVAAPLVNLCDAPEPGNPYQAIADLIRPLLNRDAATSEHILKYSVWEKEGKRSVEKPVREIAADLLEHLNGKLVKLPVMTTVYGVTAAGARAQLIEKMKEIGLDRNARYEGAAYLSRVVLDGVGELCSSASRIMGWIRTCARAIAKEGKPVCWTTPMGLKVLQSYRRYGKYRVETIVGCVWKQHVTESAPVSKKRQADGAAPNVIHGIDAAHAQRTGLSCRRADIDFLANHDSYISHAGTTTRAGQINRREFVRLHSEPILEHLYLEFQDQTKTKLPLPPEPGSFDLNNVLTSTYFFH